MLLGNGDGTFQQAMAYDSGGVDSRVVAVADVNGDGKPDLVVANSGLGCDVGQGVSVLLGNGDGTFQTAVCLRLGWQSSLFGCGSGCERRWQARPSCGELLTSDCDNGTVSVLLGNGDGTFQTTVAYGSGGNGAFFGRGSGCERRWQARPSCGELRLRFRRQCWRAAQQR